jgi:hypothetical protein
MRAGVLSTRGLIIAGLALVVLLICWYFFRPERLFINQRVDEPPPSFVPSR